MELRHEHVVASAQEWPWLPTRPGGPVIQHPYCVACGLVKAIGRDRPIKSGGLSNLVASLSDRFTATGRKVTVAQRRLILRKLAELEVEDSFSYTRESQLAVFLNVYSSFTGIPADVVVSHMEHF